jgi:hypothetical protein
VLGIARGPHNYFNAPLLLLRRPALPADHQYPHPSPDEEEVATLPRLLDFLLKRLEGSEACVKQIGPMFCWTKEVAPRAGFERSTQGLTA